MQRNLFWVSFFYAVIQFYSILITVWSLKEGQLAFPIAYICTYSLQKIIITIFIIQDFRNKKSITFHIFDLFEISFIYIFFTDNLQKTIDEFKNSKPIGIYLIAEYIIIFHNEKQTDIGYQSYLVIGQYTSFIGFTLMLVIIRFSIETEQITFYDDKKKYFQMLFRVISQVLSHYLLLCSLSFFQDKNGVKLVYNFINYKFIIEIGFLVVYYFNRKILEINDLQELYFQMIIRSMDIYFSGGIQSQLEKIFIQILNWLLQIIQLALILQYFSLNIQTYFQNEQKNVTIIKIKLIIIISSIFFSFAYILLHLKDIIFCFHGQKIFKIKNLSDLEKAANQIKKKRNSLNVYRIFILPKDIQIQENIEYKNEQQKAFLQAVSIQARLKQPIFIRIDTYNCMQSINIDNLFDLEYLHSSFHLPIKFQLNDYKYIDQLISNRIENCLIVNDLTLNIIRNKNVKKRDAHMSIIIQALQINAYLKQISIIMNNNPKEILYNLYDF